MTSHPTITVAQISAIGFNFKPDTQTVTLTERMNKLVAMDLADLKGFVMPVAATDGWNSTVIRVGAVLMLRLTEHLGNVKFDPRDVNFTVIIHQFEGELGLLNQLDPQRQPGPHQLYECLNAWNSFGTRSQNPEIPPMVADVIDLVTKSDSVSVQESVPFKARVQPEYNG